MTHVGARGESRRPVRRRLQRAWDPGMEGKREIVRSTDVEIYFEGTTARMLLD